MMINSIEQRKGILIAAIAAVLAAAAVAGGGVSLFLFRASSAGIMLSLFLLAAIPGAAYLLYRQLIGPYYRRLEDANLELHLKQEELLDMKDDLFIKFLGIYDVNYAANSPRLFTNRLKDVADITARVMEADACLIFLYDQKKDDLVLAATNRTGGGTEERPHPAREGIEGWVGRRLEPVMLKDFAQRSPVQIFLSWGCHATSRSTACRSMSIRTAPCRGHGGVLHAAEELHR